MTSLKPAFPPSSTTIEKSKMLSPSAGIAGYNRWLQNDLGDVFLACGDSGKDFISGTPSTAPVLPDIDALRAPRSNPLVLERNII